MRKKLWQSLLAAGTALMMSIGAASLVQAEPPQLTTKPTEIEAEYFTTLHGKGGEPLTGNPSLTIGKYINVEGNLDKADTTKPIGGIEFQYGKIGNLYEIQAGDTTVMAYGIQKKVATAAGIQDSADYTHGEMCFYKDGSVINKAVQKKDIDTFSSLQSSLEKGKTNDDGQIKAKLDAMNQYGLYLVMETNVSEAYVKKAGAKVPVSITRSRKPFVISIPTYITDGTGYWEEQITANVKNSTDDAEVEKKIVIGDNETLTDGTERVPIGGITFQYGKIGNLYEIQDGDTTVMAYGIQQEVATAAGLQNSADYTHGGMCFYKDGTVINQAVQEKDIDTFSSLQLSLEKEKTNDDGQIKAKLDEKNQYGLYLVMETNVSEAYVKKAGAKVPVSITRSRNPFVISIPTYITDGTGYWEEQITANVKNSTDDAEVEKKIVIGDNETLTDGTEKVADTDTTSIGDTVHFRLKGTVPSIPQNGNDII